MKHAFTVLAAPALRGAAAAAGFLTLAATAPQAATYTASVTLFGADSPAGVVAITTTPTGTISALSFVDHPEITLSPVGAVPSIVVNAGEIGLTDALTAFVNMSGTFLTAFILPEYSFVAFTADYSRVINGTYAFDAPAPTPVPLPAALPLMALALGGLTLAARRRNG